MTPRPSFLDYIQGEHVVANGISLLYLWSGPCSARSYQLASCAPHQCALLGTEPGLPRHLQAPLSTHPPRNPSQSVSHPPTHLAGGLTLNFLVAVDFTASNRDPRDPSSLHYMGQPTTQYEGGCAAARAGRHTWRAAWGATCHGGSRSQPRSRTRELSCGPLLLTWATMRSAPQRVPTHPCPCPACRRHLSGGPGVGALRL